MDKQEIIRELNRIRRKISDLEDEIEELEDELKVLQGNCQHEWREWLSHDEMAFVTCSVCGETKCGQ